MKLPHLTRKAGRQSFPDSPPPLWGRVRVGGPARPSFTLIELLVVIAIIGVLVGLLLAAVFKVLDVAYEAQTRTDVTQLSVAEKAFETQYKVGPPPSRLILCKDYLNYFNNRTPVPGNAITPLHQDSLDYLSRVFPRITTPPPGQPLPSWALPPFPPGVPPPQPGQTYTGIDWNLTGIPDQPITLSVYPVGNVPCLGAYLEGEQCLVFFLGGIPQFNANGPPTPLGFSTNPSNPAVGSDRVNPFFDFKSNRLIYLPGTFNPASLDPGYPSYLDGYGKTPYAYFSSYKNANGYNRYVYIANPYLPLVPGNPVTSDCQALPSVDPNGFAKLGVFPYIQGGLYPTPPPSPAPAPPNSPVYMNSQSFQLISAGKNYTFGPGCVITGYPGAPTNNPYWFGVPLSPMGSPMWTPSTASTLNGYGQGQPGYDDIANFYDRLLGVASP